MFVRGFIAWSQIRKLTKNQRKQSWKINIFDKKATCFRKTTTTCKSVRAAKYLESNITERKFDFTAIHDQTGKRSLKLRLFTYKISLKERAF